MVVDILDIDSNNLQSLEYDESTIMLIAPALQHMIASIKSLHMLVLKT
jgi:hypothetical protein